MKFLSFLLLFCCCVLIPEVARAELYVSGYFSNNVLRTGNDGGTLGSFIGTTTPGGNGGLFGPVGLLVNPATGDFLVAGQGNNAIKRYNATTGVYLGTYDSINNVYLNDFATGVPAPSGMLLGKNNDILVTSYDASGAVYRYQYDGTPLATITGGGLSQASAAVYGPGYTPEGEQHLYVASYGTGEILRYSYSSAGGGTYAFDSVFTKNLTGNPIFDLGSPGGLTFHEGKLYVSELEGPDNGRIMVYNGSSGEFEGVFATINQGFPAMIEFLEDDSAVVALTGSIGLFQIPESGGSGPFSFYASGAVAAPGAFLFTAVPEPGTWAAILLAFGGGVWHYRRHRLTTL
jgi:hypothetical protein